MIKKKVKYKLAEFEFPLPGKYISQYPSQRRDHAKLMVLHKDTKKIEHRKIFNISDYIRKNDLILFNNTKVYPARLYATKDRSSSKVEVFLLRELSSDN